MSETLAHFLTWTTYGTWLHGDRRGSVDRHNASPGMEYHAPSAAWERASRARMKHGSVVLSPRQREIVEAAILEHSRYKGWSLIAANCRSNHVHVLIHTGGTSARRVMNELKAYATRALRDAGLSDQEKLWTRGGSTRHIHSQASLDAAIQYVEFQ